MQTDLFEPTIDDIPSLIMTHERKASGFCRDADLAESWDMPSVAAQLEHAAQQHINYVAQLAMYAELLALAGMRGNE